MAKSRYNIDIFQQIEETDPETSEVTTEDVSVANTLTKFSSGNDVYYMTVTGSVDTSKPIIFEMDGQRVSFTPITAETKFISPSKPENVYVIRYSNSPRTFLIEVARLKGFETELSLKPSIIFPEIATVSPNSKGNYNLTQYANKAVFIQLDRGTTEPDVEIKIDFLYPDLTKSGHGYSIGNHGPSMLFDGYMCFLSRINEEYPILGLEKDPTTMNVTVKIFSLSITESSMWVVES